jgi:hypothetical protein
MGASNERVLHLFVAMSSAAEIDDVVKEFEASDPHSWHYFAQGAVNVMFRYVSAQQSKLSQDLLRIPKLQSKHGSGAAEDFNDVEEQRMFRARFFQLCGAQYMPTLIEIKIDPAFLNGLPEIGCSLIPCGFASLIQDVSAAAGGLTIEIKPKCGIVPSLSNLSSDHVCKAKTCRFCMYQYTKFNQGKVPRISSYCPIKFFSGDLEATTLSLIALLDCPQNNLKISNADGIILNSDTVDHSALTRASSCLGLAALGLDRVISLALVNSNVLQDIKRVQELDSLGIELLWKHFCDSCDSPEVLQLVDDFMLATCAKDVSIVIALQPLGSCSSEFLPVPGSSCGYRVRVIDVDQRPRSWLQKYFKQDVDILSEYLASGCTRDCVAP